MKKNLLYLLMLIGSISMFTACSDDDENKNENGDDLTIENSLAGAFSGKLGIVMNGTNLTPDGIDQKIYITKSGENEVALSLKNFSFSTFVLGDIEVDPCSVTKNDKTFTFEGSKTMSFSAAPILGECPVTVSGSVTDGKISVVIGVNVTTLKQKVTATFDGQKIGSEELVFNFEEWEDFSSTTVGTVGSYPYKDPVGSYGTSNLGVLTINEMAGQIGQIFDYPVSPVAGRTGGNAACLKTIHTAIVVPGAGEDGEDLDFNAALGGLLPYNTAGSLFTGSFKTDMNNPLNSTKFGISIKGKPDTFTGYYKYTPGATYYDSENKVVDGKEDKCSIYAVLYEEFKIKDGKGNDIIGWLNGDWKNQDSEDSNEGDRYVGASSRVIMKAVVADGSAKSDWTPFSVKFDMISGKTYDPSKKYYLAIVCSSSAEGDYYKGAQGSSLTIDDFKVTLKY